ncbi:pitrilysin family protein [Flavobacterium sp. Fl-77]|uniref:Pitrilysin family protein n=1 Tax=Flavobacterium flavipigmentatum TaxID=2893884 RepID=A0AAJ2S706_9FLAO|nr:MULTISPECIES: pitrilysin family protein [unclassified Flavobacterium]MDX6181890.1 pitrilysin family protein [Flavobacterium sp. Fl-33]MDX6185076.1 pitrilysin family protein [Flavobacterium sp. Fl-77]UFH37185.1 insulinase family protein [Flavobacterium sp. F-70]
MKKILLSGILYCSLGAISTVYSQKAEAPKYITNVEGTKEYILSNGLKVLLIPDASQSNMVVNIVYNVGSRHEGYGEKGMAHLLEHMLFKSTKNLGDIKKMLSDKGGNANGTTWLDRTNYYEVFPSSDENLKWSLEMEADRMLNATILQTDLDKEFSVVRNEFEIGENSPDGVLTERILSTAYLWHNYGNSTIGSKEDIERVKASTLRVFYEKYYQPDNATLIIAGKFDEQKALQYIGQYFGSLAKPKRVLSKTYTIEPAQDGEKFVELNRAGDSKNIGALYHTVPYADKDYAALDALGEILTSDPSGYLYKSLVETQKISSIYNWQPTVRDASFMYFGVAVPNDKDVKVTKDLVRAELDKVGTTKYTDEDVSRAKAKIIKQIESIKNNTINYAINLTEIIGAGDYRLGYLYRDAVEKLTKEDIQRVAEKYFRSNNRTVGIFIPSKDEQRVKKVEYTDEQLVALTKDYKGKALEKEVAAFESSISNLKKNLTEGTLSNGAKYGLIKKEIKGGKVQASFIFPVSNEKDLAGKSDIGGILAQLMKTGTKTRTKEQIQDRLDQLKSSVNFNFSGQNFTLNINTYKESFKEVMEIVSDLLINATFPENELTKTINEYSTSLESSLNDPQAVAFTEISRQTSKYPKESIFYTATIAEQIEAFKKIKQSELVDFYKNILGGNNGVGSVIGDLDGKSTVAILENTFGKWVSKSKYELAKPVFFETQKIDKDYATPDKENAVATGKISFKMDRKSPDYPAFVMANEIIGNGGFLTARIPMRLREKEGISYGAGSFIDVPISNDVAFWEYYAFLNPTKKGAVEAATKEEIAKALKDGFTEEELKTNLVSWQNERKTRLGNDNTLMSLVNSHLQYGVPLEDYDALESKVKALKVQDVNAVLKKYISLEKMTSVYAGDFTKK